MNKHRLLLIVPLFVVTLMVLWVFFPTGQPKTDAARYEKWNQTAKDFGRVMWWEWHLPKSIAQSLHLSTLDRSYIDEHEKLGESLVASGFLTNATFTVIAPPTNNVQRLQVMACLKEAYQGRPGWTYWVSRNKHAIIVQCRPQDEALCRQALQEWETGQ